MNEYTFEELIEELLQRDRHQFLDQLQSSGFHILEGQHVPVTIKQEPPPPFDNEIAERQPIPPRVDRDCLELVAGSTCTLIFSPRPRIETVTKIEFTGAYVTMTRKNTGDVTTSFIDISSNFSIIVNADMTVSVKHKGNTGTFQLTFLVTTMSGVYRTAVLLYF